jgi:hypothetical protein
MSEGRGDGGAHVHVQTRGAGCPGWRISAGTGFQQGIPVVWGRHPRRRRPRTSAAGPSRLTIAWSPPGASTPLGIGEVQVTAASASAIVRCRNW